MKMLVTAATFMVFLTACTLPETTEGTVHEITSETVTIRGQFSQDGSVARPTEAMNAQAEAICPGAQYLSPTPSRIHQYDYTFLYLYRCPTGPRRG